MTIPKSTTELHAAEHILQSEQFLS